MTNDELKRAPASRPPLSIVPSLPQKYHSTGININNLANRSSTHLVWTFVAPGKDVGAGVAVEPLREPTHYTLLDEIALLDCNGSERAVEHSCGLIGEGGLLHVNFGAVNLGLRVGCHG